MTLYDRQTLKCAAVLAVRRKARFARHMLESMSDQGRGTPEYEDLDSALVTLERMRKGQVSVFRPNDCARAAFGCWWTCPREERTHCGLDARVFGVAAEV
jgi:hypothetical protein